jgi:alpha-L-rhamnosidase
MNQTKLVTGLLAAVIAVFGGLLSASGAAGTATTAAAIAPAKLRCEYRVDPLGIDELEPRLTWVLTSPDRGARQSAYRILVASSRAALDEDRGDRWDTGKVESNRTANIVYAGAPLLSGRECFWKVMVWDGGGRPSAWSETARWSMGLLSPEDWKANWIGRDLPWNTITPQAFKAVNVINKLIPSPDSKVYLPAPCLRKEFNVAKPVRRAVVYVTALGLYELHLNGRRVGNDLFTPGWSDYRQRVYYQAYDVTELVMWGGNAIGAVLADGWWAGDVGYIGQRQYGSRLRLKAQLAIEYTDGSGLLVATDDSWRVGYGPIREADILAGEKYDARLEMTGWDKAGFDDQDWKKVRVDEGPAIAVQAYPGIPVRATREIKPLTVNEPQPGVFVFDLGQNFAGVARLKVSGKAGDHVVLRFAEMLNRDGTIYTTNLRKARATDTYILKGGGEEVWEPDFTYHGFRYIEVTGYPGTPGLDAVTGIVLHSDLPAAGTFACDNPLVNQIYSNLVWGQRSNYFEVPTDCPQRDERLGWTGDAQVFIRTASYNMDVAAFFTKWTVDVDDGQAADGAFPIVAPAVDKGVAAGWGDAGVVCPWTMYRVYGDTRILERHYPAMTKWMDFLRDRSPDGTSPPLGVYGDWLHVKDPSPLDLIATAFRGDDALLMADVASALGRAEDEKRYQDEHRDIARAFFAKFGEDDGRLKGDSQTDYLLALSFNLLPDDERAPAVERLTELIAARDNCLSTGFLGVKLMLPTLTDNGRLDLAYELLTNRKYPSWGYEIDQGATTIWERWNGYTIEDGFGNPSMNSYNHYAFGSVGEWLFTAVGGIDTDGPGFDKIIIRPRPGPGITEAKTSYESIHGPITTAWNVSGGEFHLDLTIPANTTATVYIPNPDAKAVRPGITTGVSFLRSDPDASVWRVDSGSYTFSAPLP